tara:strand:- start:3776 stop:4759 length:984 start_codon:yes stop_codon:yes gene_type:complete
METQEKQELVVITEEEKMVTGISGITTFLPILEKQVKEAEGSNIIDSKTLVIEDNRTKQAKKLKGQIEKKKLSITEKWRDQTKAVNEVSKRMVELLDKVINSSGSKVVAYKLEEEKKQNAILEVAKAKQGHLDTINSELGVVMDAFNKELTEVKTIEELGALSLRYVSIKNTMSWQNVWTGEAKEYPELVERINTIRASMLMIGKATRLKLLAQAAGNVKEAEKLENQASNLAQEETDKVDAETLMADNTASVNASAQVATLSKAKTSGIRKNWTFEIENANIVPKIYLKIDEDKIKDFIKMNKEFIADGKMKIPGIIFKQTAVHVS